MVARRLHLSSLPPVFVSPQSWCNRVEAIDSFPGTDGVYPREVSLLLSNNVVSFPSQFWRWCPYNSHFLVCILLKIREIWVCYCECVWSCTRACAPVLSVQVVPVFHLESLTLSNRGNQDVRGNRDLNYVHPILPLPVIITRYGLNQPFKSR